MTAPDRRLTHWTGITLWPGIPIPVDITVAYELDWGPAAPGDGEPLQMPGMTYETTITVPITPGINAAIDAILGHTDHRIPETQAPTDTCTCHCWANHPDQPGRCSAASHPGLLHDEQPVCHGCWAATRPARNAATRAWVGGVEITDCISGSEAITEDQ